MNALVRIRVTGPDGKTDVVAVTIAPENSANIGSAHTAAIRLRDDDLPKTVALLVATSKGLELRHHDSPQGAIRLRNGRRKQRMRLKAGTHFTLADHDCEVLIIEAIDATPAPDTTPTLTGAGAESGTPPIPLSGEVRNMRWIIASLFVAIVAILTAIWLLSGHPPQEHQPAHVLVWVEEDGTWKKADQASPPPAPSHGVHDSNPNFINLLIVMPRTDLDEQEQNAVRAIAADLQEAPPGYLRCSLYFTNDLEVDIDYVQDYQRVRDALKARKDRLTDLLPAHMNTDKVPEEFSELLGSPPWPLVWHIGGGDRGPNSSLAIDDLAKIELTNLNWRDTTYAQIDLKTTQARNGFPTVFDSGHYRYCFLHLPLEALGE